MAIRKQLLVECGIIGHSTLRGRRQLPILDRLMNFASEWKSCRGLKLNVSSRYISPSASSLALATKKS